MTPPTSMTFVTPYHRPLVSPFMPNRNPPTCSLADPKSRPIPTSPLLNRPVLASDLDGTLLTTDKTIHPANTAAILHALQHHGLHFLPATGKSSFGAFRAMGALGDHLLSNGFRRGVFLNGLLVRSNDRVLYERALEAHVARFVMTAAEERGLVALFYSGDTVFVRERSKLTDMFIVSHEPVPTPVGDLETVMSRKLHKALLLDPRGDVRCHRKHLEGLFRGVAHITQARADVLEVLPLGAGKGPGVELLLREMGYSTNDLVAVGDNENDIDMIDMAGVGVAVENAVQEVKDVADELVCHCDDGAIAEALKRFVLL